MSRTTNYHLRETIRQLSDIHQVLMEQFARVLYLLHVELETQEIDPWQPLSVPSEQEIPILDRATWSVTYRGRECYLGNTIAFHLFERLIRRPNRDISHLQLLNDVWHGKVSSDAIRAAVKNLRKRLRDHGMADVAIAIVGRTALHYAFAVSKLN